jgi:hypothetical protein
MYRGYTNSSICYAYLSALWRKGLHNNRVICEHSKAPWMLQVGESVLKSSSPRTRVLQIKTFLGIRFCYTSETLPSLLCTHLRGIHQVLISAIGIHSSGLSFLSWVWLEVEHAFDSHIYEYILRCRSEESVIPSFSPVMSSTRALTVHLQ